MKYNLSKKDFEKAFEFSVNYYLDPSKSPAGRTSGEPRGFGAVLDNFTRGKLVEIGAKKILEASNNNKKYNLDFEIKKTSEVKEEPDIISISDNKQIREPKLFVEIKNTSISDRWIGLTDEQLDTMKKYAKGKKIYMIYISLSAESNKYSSKSSDFVGMYLKKISGLNIFNNFASLNATAKLEFIISLDELEEFGTPFPKGDLLFETNLFDNNVKIHKKDGSLRKNINEIDKKIDYNGKIIVESIHGKVYDKLSEFQVNGSFNIYEKINEKSKRNYIECTSDVVVENDIFGIFKLKKGKIYNFNTITVGRDPILKRNNLWISKRKVYQLIEEGRLQFPTEVINEISKDI